MKTAFTKIISLIITVSMALTASLTAGALTVMPPVDENETPPMPFIHDIPEKLPDDLKKAMNNADDDDLIGADGSLVMHIDLPTDVEQEEHWLESCYIEPMFEKYDIPMSRLKRLGHIYYYRDDPNGEFESYTAIGTWDVPLPEMPDGSDFLRQFVYGDIIGDGDSYEEIYHRGIVNLELTKAELLRLCEEDTVICFEYGEEAGMYNYNEPLTNHVHEWEKIPADLKEAMDKAADDELIGADGSLVMHIDLSNDVPCIEYWLESEFVAPLLNKYDIPMYHVNRLGDAVYYANDTNDIPVPKMPDGSSFLRPFFYGTYLDVGEEPFHRGYVNLALTKAEIMRLCEEETVICFEYGEEADIYVYNEKLSDPRLYSEKIPLDLADVMEKTRGNDLIGADGSLVMHIDLPSEIPEVENWLEMCYVEPMLKRHDIPMSRLQRLGANYYYRNDPNGEFLFRGPDESTPPRIPAMPDGSNFLRPFFYDDVLDIGDTYEENIHRGLVKIALTHQEIALLCHEETVICFEYGEEAGMYNYNELLTDHDCEWEKLPADLKEAMDKAADDELIGYNGSFGKTPSLVMHIDLPSEVPSEVDWLEHSFVMPLFEKHDIPMSRMQRSAADRYSRRSDSVNFVMDETNDFPVPKMPDGTDFFNYFVYGDIVYHGDGYTEYRHRGVINAALTKSEIMRLCEDDTVICFEYGEEADLYNYDTQYVYYTSGDALTILRASLESYDVPDMIYDLDMDGRCTSADALEALRISIYDLGMTFRM